MALMPLKYYCPKCNKRFVDWGAEKLNFKCPDCADETLIRVGAEPESDDSAPSLSKSASKRKAKAKPKEEPIPEPSDDDSTPDLDDDDLGGDDDDGDVLDDSLTDD